MTLTEFLLTRIAEDEAGAERDWHWELIARRDYAQRLLATVYADHPDYDPEWCL